MTTPTPAQAAQKSRRLFALALELTADPNNMEKRSAYMRCAFNVDWTAAAIVAMGAKVARDERPEPTPEHEALADEAHAKIRAEVGSAQPHLTLAMLRTWKAAAEPADEQGRISFSRALLDSATDALAEVLGLETGAVA